MIHNENIDWSEPLTLAVTDDDLQKRLDVIIAERTEMTRSAIQKIIEDGRVLLNGKRAIKKDKPSLGDLIEIFLPEPVPSEAVPEDIPLEIIYEDEHLLVVNKQKGMVVHPAPGNYNGTLVNALLYHCKGSLSGIGGVIRPGIVHRIDKDTSGLLVVAKTDKAHLSLSEQISTHSFLRSYEAIIIGGLKNNEGVVDAPIARHPVNRQRMAIVSGGKDAVTHYSVIGRYDGFTHIHCRLETGRTHQIRVHMASIGHPILFDEVYGQVSTPFERYNKSLCKGQCLHAREIGFVHPTTGKSLHFISELPCYFSDVLLKLERKGRIDDLNV